MARTREETLAAVQELYKVLPIQALIDLSRICAEERTFYCGNALNSKREAWMKVWNISDAEIISYLQILAQKLLNS